MPQMTNDRRRQATIFLVSGAAFFASQVGRFNWNSVASTSAYLQSHPGAGTWWTAVNGGAAVAAFPAVAGVLGLADPLGPARPGLVRWTSALAVIGYAIPAVTNVADLYQIRRLAASYPLHPLQAHAEEYQRSNGRAASRIKARWRRACITQPTSPIST
jgi:hypothetical protein